MAIPPLAIKNFNCSVGERNAPIASNSTTNAHCARTNWLSG
ncbi:hypothetical protein [Glutamicibacter sp. JC586]|nr:hypothetical protein [Glutamicibacter sp. JC586]